LSTTFLLNVFIAFLIYLIKIVFLRFIILGVNIFFYICAKACNYVTGPLHLRLL